MTFTEAAVEVLRLAGKPLHFKDITQMAIEKNLLSHVGKTPDVTMGARLSLQIKKDPDGLIVRVKPGIFSLRDLDAGTKKKKSREPVEEAAAPPPAVAEVDDPNADEEDSTADEVAALATAVDEASITADARSTRESSRGQQELPAQLAPEPDDDEPILDEEERMRGQIAASASDLFEEEDDDDQPLLGGPDPAAAGEGGRRRRRRRRRGKGRDEPLVLPTGSPAFATRDGAEDDEDTIGFTIGDDRDEQPTRRAIVLERVATPSAPRPRHPDADQPRNFRGAPRQDWQDRGERNDRGGPDRGSPDRGAPERGPDRGERAGSDRGERHNFRDRGPAPQVAPRGEYGFDVATSAGFDQGEGPIDDLVGRDLADVAMQILVGCDRNQGAVPVRAIADAAARRGRLALDPQMAASAIAAAIRADNLRRAAEGQRARFRLSQGRAAPTEWSITPELARAESDVAAAVERYREAARRAFAMRLAKDTTGQALVELVLVLLERLGFRDLKSVRRAGLPGGETHFAGVHVSGGDEIRTAIVLRRDGREIGRERVIDLRGSLHHYGPATAGWLLTTGQCLSGAREEASAPGTTPVALFDAYGLARLMEENDVAVCKTRFELPFPDLDLFESLKV